MDFFKKILKIIVIFAAGIVGGIFGDQIISPHVFGQSLAGQNQPVYINQTKQVTITENTALQNAAAKAENVILGVRTVTQSGKVIEGSGLILTSDGLAVTLNDLIPQGAEFHFYVGGQQVSYQITKRDSADNLALIKLSDNNLPTAGFGSVQAAKLGQEVFLTGFIFQNGVPQAAVDQGIVRTLDGTSSLGTTIIEPTSMMGSTLFDIQGNILGINNVDQSGRIVTISIEKIRQISGL